MATHPLTSTSRRRRMIMYLSRQQAPAGAQTADVAVKDRETEDDSIPILPAPVAKRSDKPKAVPTRPPVQQRLTSHQHQLRIRTLLSQQAPANWVFCGDSLLAMSDRSRDWPSYVGHFSHFVRWQIRRFPDVVIDACLPEDSLAVLNAQLEQRVLRFQPHAVFVMCGRHEANAGLAGLQRFENALQSMLQSFLSRGITPVVHTPPCPVDPPQPEQLVYVEAIRSITAEQDVPLVDHWEAWEAAAAGDSTAWFEPKSSVPGKIGHEKIAELMLRKLGLTTQVEAVKA